MAPELKIRPMEAKETYASLEKLFPGKVRDFKGDVIEPYLNVEKAAYR